MADLTPPYVAFNFDVELILDTLTPGVSDPVCRGSFSECDGLEMTMEPKVVREGGNNQEQIHLIGPISYGQLTLKRGMTGTLELWNWFAAAGRTGRRSTAQGRIIQLDAAGRPQVLFTLTNCLPVKMRGPSFHAKDGQIAIEEMQLVYSNMTVRSLNTFGIGINIGIGASAGVGVGVSGSLSVSGGLGLSGGVSVGGHIAANLDI